MKKDSSNYSKSNLAPIQILISKGPLNMTKVLSFSKKLIQKSKFKRVSQLHLLNSQKSKKTAIRVS
jgi:hypothetical protein